MKPIHKYNNGNGATLCNQCNSIISSGHVNDLYCEPCNEHRKKILTQIMEEDEALGLYIEQMKKEEYIQLIRAQEQIIKELKRSMSLYLMTGIAVGVLVTNLIYILLK